MLYICPHCGKWMISLGLAEAFALAQGASINQPCPDCSRPMRRFQNDDKVHLQDAAKRGPSERKGYDRH
jgi:hypothetical protein